MQRHSSQKPIRNFGAKLTIFSSGLRGGMVPFRFPTPTISDPARPSFQNKIRNTLDLGPKPSTDRPKPVPETGHGPGNTWVSGTPGPGDTRVLGRPGSGIPELAVCPGPEKTKVSGLPGPRVHPGTGYMLALNSSRSRGLIFGADV